MSTRVYLVRMIVIILTSCIISCSVHAQSYLFFSSGISYSKQDTKGPYAFLYNSYDDHWLPNMYVEGMYQYFIDNSHGLSFEVTGELFQYKYDIDHSGILPITNISFSTFNTAISYVYKFNHSLSVNIGLSYRLNYDYTYIQYLRGVNKESKSYLHSMGVNFNIEYYIFKNFGLKSAYYIYPWMSYQNNRFQPNLYNHQLIKLGLIFKINIS